MNIKLNIPEFGVTQFNKALKDVIEDHFSYVRIKGEISEIRVATKGQIYITLKDETSILSAVVWEQKKRLLSFEPEIGMEVILIGRITTWSKFKTTYQVDIDNIEDTKLQSKLIRKYTDKHGLKDLVKEFIGIDISKQHQSSDFGGELSTAQIKYCANDVIYLHKINEALNKMLIRENRINLYKDCLKFLNTRVNLDLECFPDDIWSH